MRFYTLIFFGSLLASAQSWAGENTWTVGDTPDGGSAYSLWVDTQTTPYTLFSEMGNSSTLYHSTDKGENWVLSQAPLLPNELNPEFGSTIVKDPHADIWYALQASTGVFYKREGLQGEWVAVTADAGFELPIQTNGYNPTALPERRIQVRLIAPTTPSSIYVNLVEGFGLEPDSGKIYRSQDGGKRWEEMFDTLQDNDNESLSFFPNLFADPNNPTTLYTIATQTTGQGDAATSTMRLYQSTDGGKHWTATNHPASDTFRVATVVATQPATLYSFTFMSDAETWGLNRSTLTGDSFTTLTLFPTSNADFYTRGIQLFANAQQPQTLYAIQTAHYRNFPNYYRSLRYPPVQNAGLEFNRVYKSLDGGNSWTLLQAGLPYSTISHNRIYGGAIDPSNADIFYMASSYGILKTVDGGSHWQFKNQGIHETRMVDALFSPSSITAIDTPSAYLYSNDEFFQSTDRGETWQPLNLSLSATNLTVNTYQTPFKFYGYTNDCQSLSIQVQGETEIIHPLPTALQACPNRIKQLITVPYDNKVLYLITNPVDGKVSMFKTTDDGATWSTLFEEMNLISTFIVDPIKPQVLYKIMVNLYRSTDDGQTWQVIGNTDLFSSIVQLKIATDTGTLYVESYKGIFKSTDDGATWTMINHGLQGKIESYNNDENLSFTGGELTLSASNKIYARSFNMLARYYPEKNAWCPVAPLTSVYNWRIDAYDENTFYGRDFLRDGIVSYTRNNPESPTLFSDLLGAYVVNRFDTTDAVFKGGIQLSSLCTDTAKGFYLPLTSPVDIRGTIQPATADIGKTADIVVYAAFKHPLLPNQTLYFMLGEDNSIQVWDGQDVSALVPFKHNVTLAEQNEVIMYQGQFVATGQLFIRFGYRLADGTLIINQESLVVDID